MEGIGGEHEGALGIVASAGVAEPCDGGGERGGDEGADDPKPAMGREEEENEEEGADGGADEPDLAGWGLCENHLKKRGAEGLHHRGAAHAGDGFPKPEESGSRGDDEAGLAETCLSSRAAGIDLRRWLDEETDGEDGKQQQARAKVKGPGEDQDCGHPGPMSSQ